jgi:hypothetical protein
VKRDEQQIHKAVVQHLRLRGVKGLMFWHTPNSLAIPGRKGAILGGINKSLGVFQGVSDLLLFHKSQLYALELKVDAGHVTPSQARFIEDLLERVLGLKQPVGAPAHRGTAVEAGVAQGLLDPEATLETCVEVATIKYDTLMALSPDQRREKYRTDIPGMVQQALAELRPYGVPSGTQGFVEWKPEGLKYPVVGYYDFKWEDKGIIVDLKTSEKMPSEIKVAHARQVSLYAFSDNMDARLVYCTPKRINTYRLENIREHREALYRIARNVETFLSLSEDPQYFLKITAPDLDSFYWGGPARQLAYEHWRI